MRNVTIVLLVLLCVGAATLAGVAFNAWYVHDVRHIPLEVNVTDQPLIGFTTDTDRLRFGTVTRGGHAERKATVVSAQDAVVFIKTTGAVGSWVSVSDNSFRIDAGVPREVLFRLTVPEGTLPGDYAGEAVITYHAPLPWQ